MSGGELPAPVPVVLPETEAFWEATGRGVLLVPHCRACGAGHWYPRGLCPTCGSTDLEWVEASGRGTVYSFTVIRRGEGPYREAGAYVLAYVEIEDGLRLLTNVVGCEPEDVTVGMAVEVVFAGTAEGPALPRFRPSGG